MKRIFILLIIGFAISAKAQVHRFGSSISNNTTGLPITGYGSLFYSQFHPGAEVFYEYKLNKKEVNQFWIKGTFGGYYHRFFQTALRLQLDVDYRLAFSKFVALDIALGGGYLHSFTDYQRFKLNDQGEYEKIHGIAGRAQFVAGLTLGANVALLKSDPEKIRLLIQFRTLMQGPFVANYVPLLPVNSFLLGLSFPLKPGKHETTLK